jgi:hypothetical protein
MFEVMRSVIKDTLTEKDGVSYDVTKVQWFVGTLVYFGCTVYSVVTRPDHAFDFTSWSVGFASILAAGSFGVKIKESTEQTTVAGDPTQQLSKTGQ